MMRLGSWLILGLALAIMKPAYAQAVEPKPEVSKLIIHGATAQQALQPLMDAFIQRHPNLRIQYQAFDSNTLYQHFLEDTDNPPDLMLSPAMHLQFKLVNDGYGLNYRSAQTDRLPERVKWNNELFGYAFDPIVLVVNTDILVGAPLPRSRDELQELIRSKNHLLDEKIGLPDITSSALGYLTWSYDSQLSRTYERRLEAFGARHAKRYPNTPSMLKALVRGEVFIAYNALGSYTQAWTENHPWVVAVQPSDYTTVLTRTAFIPKTARHPNSAKIFLDFLLSDDGQRLLAERSGLIPINASNGVAGVNSSSLRSLKPVPLGLELLLQTDSARQQLLFGEWREAMRHRAH